jgi:lipoprotein-releasing system ATP-binding protein
MSSLPAGAVLSCRGLEKTYGMGEVAVPVLKGIDLEVRRGESIAIVGASGSGKSTLLHLLGGLDRPTAGSVTLLGQDMLALDAEAQGKLRNRSLGFVYQFHHLLPEFSALENVAMPLTIRRAPEREANERATAMLNEVGLGHRLAHRPGSSPAASGNAWRSPARS